MKSRTSFFNSGIAKNLLHRCWPLWAGYQVFLLLILPLVLRQQTQSIRGYIGSIPMLDNVVAGMGEEMIVISFGISILAAMAMFSYLYQSRSCGMMNALPVTRTSMFFTVWLTGLLPLLLADLLAVLLCMPFVAAQELSLRVLATLLGVMALSKLCFYGFASLCAMLTGSLIILPLVYLVLSFTAYVAELATRFVLSKVIFGLDPDVLCLSWLSPPVGMLAHYSTQLNGVGEELVIRGPGTVAVYGAVGVLLTVLAWRLYLRRRMESATDTVAIPVLKPVFKYCMAYGCGILLATFVHDALLGNTPRGLSAALVTAAAVLAGSLIGYFAAEMLIRKTVWVFRGGLKGWLAFALAAVLVIVACEADLFGWEKSRPKAERIVSVSFNDTEYREEGSIRKILELQEGIVRNKKQHEISDSDMVGTDNVRASVHLSYTLDNGRVISREYDVFGKQEDAQDPETDLSRLQGVINLPEALRYRSVSKVQVIPENVINFQAEFDHADSSGEDYHSTVRFTPEEAVDFYENALLADLAENTVGRRFLLETATPELTNVTLQMEITDGASLAAGRLRTESTSWYYINVYADNRHCLEWLREHTDQEILTSVDGAWARCGADGFFS